MSEEKHGTVIGRLCFELDAPTVMVGRSGEEFTATHQTIGLLIYYRTGEAQVRLDGIAVSALSHGTEWFIANFIPSEKVPEPPFVEGNLVASTETRGEPLLCGYITSRQNEHGKAQYAMRLYSLPVSGWRRAIEALEPRAKAIYLRLKP